MYKFLLTIDQFLPFLKTMDDAQVRNSLNSDLKRVKEWVYQ